MVMGNVVHAKITNRESEHMKLKNQLSNRELSEKLKKLGVRQESVFYWREVLIGRHQKYEDRFKITLGRYLDHSGDVIASAFTVAELGEMLPWEKRFSEWLEWYEEEKDQIYRRGFGIHPRPKDEWMCEYLDRENLKINGTWIVMRELCKTEADARAAMLIHLLENKIITVEEVNAKDGRMKPLEEIAREILIEHACVEMKIDNEEEPVDYQRLSGFIMYKDDFIAYEKNISKTLQSERDRADALEETLKRIANHDPEYGELFIMWAKQALEQHGTKGRKG